MPYQIIDTDYNNYAFLYSCESFFWGAWTLEYAWVLQRDPHSELNERIRGHAKTVFRKEVPKFDFDEEMRETHHSKVTRTKNECNYEPEVLQSLKKTIKFENKFESAGGTRIVDGLNN